ncbi:hypothetical protein DESC_80003 [Desulfosarcina cetonica]|nr:hypothetical protein DESC_80003 [Desulfosarcina cetonica]
MSRYYLDEVGRGCQNKTDIFRRFYQIMEFIHKTWFFFF